MSDKTFNCPICGAVLYEDPSLDNFDICRQCGVEFGNEDRETYPQIIERWQAAGRPVWIYTNGEKAMWESIWNGTAEPPLNQEKP